MKVFEMAFDQVISALELTIWLFVQENKCIHG